MQKSNLFFVDDELRLSKVLGNSKSAKKFGSMLKDFKSLLDKPPSDLYKAAFLVRNKYFLDIPNYALKFIKNIAMNSIILEVVNFSDRYNLPLTVRQI